jgi:hypothetical protein
LWTWYFSKFIHTERHNDVDVKASGKMCINLDWEGLKCEIREHMTIFLPLSFEFNFFPLLRHRYTYVCTNWFVSLLGFKQAAKTNRHNCTLIGACRCWIKYIKKLYLSFLKLSRLNYFAFSVSWFLYRLKAFSLCDDLVFSFCFEYLELLNRYWNWINRII